MLPVGLLAVGSTVVRAVEGLPTPRGAWAPSLPLEQAPDGEVVPITDPARLVAMGFPAGAQNVYMHSGIFTGARPPEVAVSPQFGSGANANYTSIAPKAFIGRQSTAAAPWQYSGGAFGCCDYLSRLGTEEFADAEFNLPPGVSLQSVRYWGVDNHATDDIAFSIIQTCLPVASAGGGTVTILAQGQTTGATGFQSGLLAGSPVTVTTRDCTYKARIHFPGTTSLTFQKLRIEWRRQVSPPPGFATFADVPVTHFYFRYIEALAATGITAGCAPILYCPDAPVTRAQMAVFLSVALGLAAQ
jgi:hypothetical protein